MNPFADETRSGHWGSPRRGRLRRGRFRRDGLGDGGSRFGLLGHRAGPSGPVPGWVPQTPQGIETVVEHPRRRDDTWAGIALCRLGLIGRQSLHGLVKQVVENDALTGEHHLERVARLHGHDHAGDNLTLLEAFVLGQAREVGNDLENLLHLPAGDLSGGRGWCGFWFGCHVGGLRSRRVARSDMLVL